MMAGRKTSKSFQNKKVIRFLKALITRFKHIIIRLLVGMLIVISLFFMLFVGCQIYEWIKNEKSGITEEKIKRRIDSLYSTDLDSLVIKPLTIPDSTIYDIIWSHNTELISLLKVRIELNNNWHISYTETMRQSRNIYFGILAVILTILFTTEKINKIIVLWITLAIIFLMFFLDVDHQFQHYKNRNDLIRIDNSVNKLINLKPYDKTWYEFYDPINNNIKKLLKEHDPDNNKNMSKKRRTIKWHIAFLLNWDRFVYYEIPITLIIVLLWVQKIRKFLNLHR